MFYYYLNFSFLNYINFNYSFIKYFSFLSYKIFNEGYLIDFNQKKLIANLLKKSIFSTFFLFNDKFIFEKLVFFLIDFLTWSKNFLFLSEINSPNFYFNLTIVYTCLLIIFLI